MAVLRISNGQGRELSLWPINGPGEPIRFAVGAPSGDRSAVWRLWANKSKNDIYFANRDLAHHQKISLHESGSWRFQWTKPEVAERFAPGQGRLIQEWNRPPEIRPGWTSSLVLWVDESDVVPMAPVVSNGKPIRWVPKPETGQLIAFHVIIGRLDQGPVAVPRSQPVAAFTLTNGDIVLVIAVTHTLTESRRRWLFSQRARLSTAMGSLIRGHDTPRAVLFRADEYGNAIRWDIALWAKRTR